LRCRGIRRWARGNKREGEVKEVISDDIKKRFIWTKSARLPEVIFWLEMERYLLESRRYCRLHERRRGGRRLFFHSKKKRSELWIPIQEGKNYPQIFRLQKLKNTMQRDSVARRYMICLIFNFYMDKHARWILCKAQ
jgi:hypothetical protein